MPQVDLETLVSACSGGAGDSKIACETLADSNLSVDNSEISDNPPHSFWLSTDAELDWFDRNAFYERKESTKGNSNSTNLNPHLNKSNSVSQRFSLPLKSKASIIGLPKPQKSCFSEAKLRRNIKSPKARLFPKRSAPGGKSAVSSTEPSSPKVSCMGRVRSKKDRSRRSKIGQSEFDNAKKEKACRKHRIKIWASLTEFFKSGGGKQKPLPAAELAVADPKSSLPQRKNFTVTSPTSCKEVNPPGLGGALRYASGRRSESWLAGKGESM